MRVDLEFDVGYRPCNEEHFSLISPVSHPTQTIPIRSG